MNQAPVSVRGQHHVLLVDDTESMRVLYARFLESDGYRVTTASSGAEALAALGRELPDLILLDHMMPGMSGIEVLQRIRAEPRLAEIPTIFLTASTLDVDAAFAIGATDYFTKPIDRRMLLARVRAIVSSRRLSSAAVQWRRMEADHGKLLEELRHAREVQETQLPTMPRRWPGWSADAALVPCTSVGGDAFDIVEGPDGRRTATLVDVSGHGLAAALVASSVQSMLRLLLGAHSLERALYDLNRLLCASNDEHYACVALAEVSGDSVTVLNAGLPPVMAIRDGAVRWEVSACGPPPGLVADAEYRSVRHLVEPGDRIVLASDGLTEALGPLSTPPTLADALRGAFDGSPEHPVPLLAMIQRMRRNVQPDSDDDATLMVLERHRD